jgi:hypothetical protein
MPDTGVLYSALSNATNTDSVNDQDILRIWQEWRAIEQAMHRMNKGRKQEKLSDRQCDLEVQIEDISSSSPIAVAAKIDVALSQMGYDEFLSDSPQNYLCAALRSMADRLPAEMTAALSLAIASEPGHHLVGEIYTGKIGHAYLLSRYEEACEDLAGLPHNCTDSSREPYYEQRAKMLSWIFLSKPEGIDDVLLKLKLMTENINDVVDQGAYFSHSFRRGLEASLSLLKASTSAGAGEASETKKGAA